MKKLLFLLISFIICQFISVNGFSQNFDLDVLFDNLLIANTFEFQGHLLDKDYELVSPTDSLGIESWAYGYDINTNKAPIWVFIQNVELKEGSPMISGVQFFTFTEKYAFDLIVDQVKKGCMYKSTIKDDAGKYYKLYTHGIAKSENPVAIRVYESINSYLVDVYWDMLGLTKE